MYKSISDNLLSTVPYKYLDNFRQACLRHQDVFNSFSFFSNSYKDDNTATKYKLFCNDVTRLNTSSDLDEFVDKIEIFDMATKAYAVIKFKRVSNVIEKV